MKYAFAELFDIPTISRICESFSRLENCATAFLDLEGNVHVATGWQEICTKFHRADPRTCARCRESDTALAGKLAAGEPYNLYRCRNGLIDVAVPVMVAGEHAGNFFTGQFFLGDPDQEFFRNQAREFGFDEEAYAQSLSKVPVYSESRVKQMMGFLVELTQLIGELGLDKLRRLEVEASHRLSLTLDVRARTHELETAKDRLQKIISSTYSPIISVDAAQRIILFNEAAEQAFGWKADEAIGRPLDILIPTDHVDRHSDYVGRFADSGLSYRKMAESPHVQARRRDGSLFPAEIALSRIDTSDGPVMTAIVRDLSEQHALQARLVQSEKMKAFGQLAGGIAHDFNNLLAIISSSAELLSLSDKPEASLESSLRLITRTCQRAKDLTTRLLVFARKSALQPRLIDVPATMEDIVQMLKRLMGEHIKMSFSVDGADLYVRADPGQFHTAILNLAINARDAMPEGGEMHISCSGRPSSQGASRGQNVVRISLQDTGVGIPPDMINRIFEPFFTTKQAEKGTGLGLPMVYGFVNEAGGDIDVESAPNKGTLFTLTLPAEDPPAVVAETAAEPFDMKGLRVLLVEDDDELRYVATINLTRNGLIVTPVSSAEEARGELDSGYHYDLLLTDFRLGPGATGSELARYAQQRRPDLSIVINSGYMDRAEAGIIDPAWGFLAKPFKLQELQAVLAGRKKPDPAA